MTDLRWNPEKDRWEPAPPKPNYVLLSLAAASIVITAWILWQLGSLAVRVIS